MDHQASRRQFLRTGLALAALVGNGLPFGISKARADSFAALSRPFLANIMLNGGPDMRHLLMPRFSAVTGSYGREFWRARASAHGADDVATVLEQRWNEDYLPVADGATEFGILKQAAWLHEMWTAGKVALVCGVLNDSSRDHELAIRSMEMGNRLADKFTFGSGWGGRLAQATNSNVIALTTSPRRFSFGPNPDAPDNLSLVDNRRMIPAANMREIALAEAAPDSDYYGFDDKLKRGLKQYYAERRATINKHSVYAQFFEHERKLRELGAVIDARLATVPIPPAIEALFADTSVTGYDLALQTRNLYDALACNDLLDVRIASMDFNGWDTHNNQREEFAASATALFGSDGALATLYAALAPAVRSNVVFQIGGEFGRQLAANLGGGTDHGEGLVTILIGDAVQGGVYGTMFPESEIARLGEESAQIQGVNAIDHVFGRVAEWVMPGSKAQVFPNAAGAPLEAGLDLSGMFRA
ncbi:MAG: DUF1501 domain-containing protein [Gammaproteobacteria bacterium]|nr:DUF1501 domain-containing protein [Gammaproteobacteria bacterium]